jgi:XapX domain-containing protein
MVDLTLTLLATLTGVVTGALFKFLEIPIPAPPELPGLLGIVGIYVGFKLVEYLGVSFDVLEALGLA